MCHSRPFLKCGYTRGTRIIGGTGKVDEKNLIYFILVRNNCTMIPPESGCSQVVCFNL